MSVVLLGATLATAGDMDMKNHDMSIKKTDHTRATPLKDEGSQKTCPVMGNPINKEIFVDHEGQRIYFCCPGCNDPFKKNPAKYLKKLSDNGEKPALLALRAQTTCPVMNKPINKKLYVDHNGKRMYVCCGGCKKKVTKQPEKYFKKLEEMGEEPEGL